MSRETLRDVASRFDRVRVLVVGDPILDEYLTGECTRISPEAPIPVVRVRETRSVLGGAANTAANIAALGGQVVLAGVVGDDESGQRISELAEGSGILTLFVREPRPSSRKVRVLGGQQQLLRLDYEDDRSVTSASADAVLAHAAANIAGVQVVVVSDYAKGLVSPAFCQALMTTARAAGIPVVIDPRPQNGEAYSGCDYLTPNWREALALAGVVDRPPSADLVASVGRQLVQRFGAAVLLTLGAQGLRFFGRDGGQTFDEPAQAREVFDVSGAGDTVVAAFSLALAAGGDVRTAMRVANLAAGVVVGKVGTATVSRPELLRDVDRDERLVAADELLTHVRNARAAGRRIGVVSGRFDALKPDTLARIRDVAGQTGLLIVLVKEGEEASDGVFLALGLRDVSLVCAAVNVEELIVQIAPDVHVLHSTSAAPAATGRDGR